MVKGLEKKGVFTDITLYEFVTQNPGLCCYELAKKIEWSSGKVSHSLRRLAKSGYINFDKIPGRTKKLVYPMNWADLGSGQAKKKC